MITGKRKGVGLHFGELAGFVDPDLAEADTRFQTIPLFTRRFAGSALDTSFVVEYPSVLGHMRSYL